MPFLNIMSNMKCGNQYFVFSGAERLTLLIRLRRCDTLDYVHVIHDWSWMAAGYGGEAGLDRKGSGSLWP